MKFFIKLIAFFLLLLNGAGAIYGGWNLITHPDGSSIQLSSQWLRNTPFENFLIPGIVLLVSNGLLSFLVMGTMFFRVRNYPWYIMGQGAILTGWLVIQIAMIQTVYFLHFIMFTVGILLLITGWLIRKEKRQEERLSGNKNGRTL